MQTAHVFNIERFATEDGPGIRTVVFLKGCALRCRWCANPESQSLKNEILFLAQKCQNCGKCITICPNHAIEFKDGFGYITDQERCSYCQKCVENCFADARSPMGQEFTAEQLTEEILKDKQYFQMSFGGVTFSGGEPFLQGKLIQEVAAKLKKDDITTLVETCGYADTDIIKEVSKEIDYIYYDIKQMDSQKHKQLTGHGNELIIENLKWLSENFKGELSVRYPYIPGCNDDRKDIRSFFEFVSKLPNIKEVVFLPYHRLGIPKYQGLGREYLMGNMKSLKKTQLEYLLDIGKEYNVSTKIQ